MKGKKTALSAVIILCLGMMLSGCGGGSESNSAGDEDMERVSVTNVSYDPTRELYAAYNEAFRTHYEAEKGIKVNIIQSHGGSGSQARSVVEGANADVVTLALAHDITLIEDAGLIDNGWIDEFDRDSSPYTSTIVFLVRAGNEKDIHDWDDLIKDGVGVITPRAAVQPVGIFLRHGTMPDSIFRKMRRRSGSL